MKNGRVLRDDNLNIVSLREKYIMSSVSKLFRLKNYYSFENRKFNYLQNKLQFFFEAIYFPAAESDKSETF